MKVFLVPKQQQQFLSSRASMIYRAVGTLCAGGTITSPPWSKAKYTPSNCFELLHTCHLPSKFSDHPRAQMSEFNDFLLIKNPSIFCQGLREINIFPYFTIF